MLNKRRYLSEVLDYNLFTIITVTISLKFFVTLTNTCAAQSLEMELALVIVSGI